MLNIISAGKRFIDVTHLLNPHGSIRLLSQSLTTSGFMIKFFKFLDRGSR